MTKTSLVGNIGMERGVGEGASGGLFWVKRTPRSKLHIWNFWISSDSGKCLLTFLTVVRGHVRYPPLRITWSQVSLVGKPASP